MKNTANEKTGDNKFRFRGPERYYAVAGRQLDEKTNDGTDNFVTVFFIAVHVILYLRHDYSSCSYVKSADVYILEHWAV